MNQKILPHSVLLISLPQKLLLGALLIMLHACSTPGITDQGSTGFDIPDEILGGDESTLQALLAQATLAASPQREQILYQSSMLLHNLERDNDALELLESLDIRGIPLELATDILLLRARLETEGGRPFTALGILTNNRLSQLPMLPQQKQMAVHLFRAELFNEAGRFLDSARERILADQLLPLNLIPLNHEQIWKALTALDPDDLREMVATERRFEFQGWYELAIIGKAYQYNLDRQLVELASWRSSWTRHPAAVYLPQALQLVETMAEERPDIIALMLPLDTQSGRVIRDGFMSAYYDVMQIGGKVPEVRLYNTTNTIDIIEQYNQAVADGAQMVIGPLLKDHVVRLHDNPSLPVPTLALNNLEGSDPLSDNMFQFALSPENEAEQLAERAWQDGHRNAAVLSPAIVSDDYYQRKLNAFTDRWLTLGGNIVVQQQYRQNYTGIVETLLDINESEARKDRLSELINEDLAFTQRRRQDIDMIFLIAEPGPARQINPTLAYLYAGDIPVYASQDVYSGIPRPLVDNDLNGIIFGDSPWLLTFNDELKEKASTLFPQNSALTLRLQAFGVDAFRLYPRLKQLESVPDSQIYGASGLLKLGENRNILRELSWAKVSDGLVQIETPESEP